MTRHSLLALAIAAVALPAVAQVDAPELVAGAGSAPTDSKQANQGVYVRDSAVAAEKLALGERMERLKEWDKAADVFQEILEKYPDRVVQSTAPGHANQYASVIVAVQQRLAKWPADGLRAYRNRYESPAAELLAGAARDDYGTINNVYQRYFATDAGKAAGLRLVDLYLENGEFPAAAWLGDRLLLWHPTIATDKPKLFYRVAVAYQLSGDKDKAAARLDELKSTAPDATGTVRGQDVNLADSLAKDLASTSTAVAHVQSPESWPVFMGDPSRGRISAGMGRAGARPFSSIDLVQPNVRTLPADQRQDFESIDKLDREKGLNIGVIPSVDRGEMFFQDGSRVYAVGLDSGSPLPGWAQTYAGTGQFATNNALLPTSRRQQYTVTVTDSDLLAVVGQTNGAARMVQLLGQIGSVGGGDTRLVCLDRATGKEKWSKSPRDFPDQGNVRSLSLGGSPLVVGDNVYVCGTGGKSQQFDDCYVFCLDRATGAHKWSAYVCSASSGQPMFGGEGGGLAPDTVCSVTYSSGRLYTLTNLGAVAALDAYSGSIVWLDTYERDHSNDPSMMRFGMPTASQLTKPWSYNAAVVQNGRVFALPSDGKHLTVYDAATGDPIKRVNLSDVDNADTLVGVQQGNLILSSDTRVYAFAWESYDPAKFSPRSGVIKWASSFPKSPVRGRGFLTADSVFVPTKDRLYRIGTTSGKIEDSYPPFTRGGWEEPEGPGNVLVTEDKVVIAGASRISVYTDLAVARAKLDQLVAASPADADLRLRYADMLFVSGDLKAAMAKLDESLGLLGGAGNLTPGAGRDRAFHTALTFAQKLADPKTYAPANREVIGHLFDEAASAATSATQNVEYRTARAKFADAIRDYPAEAKLYQEVLADDAMRNVALGTADGASSQPAAAVAEAAITALVRTAGAQVYAPYDRAAKEAMDVAQAAGKADDLLQVARKFPNAAVASESLFHAAEAYEVAGDNRRATQVLRQLYFRYPAANKSAVLEAMARNYLLIPGRADVAAARLTQGATFAKDVKLAKPLKLPNGQMLENVTFAQAAEALKLLQTDAVEKSLPKFGLPTEAKLHVKPLAQSDLIPNVAALIPSAGREYSRNDRAVTFSTDGQIACYTPGSAQPLWLTKSLADAPRECAWVGNNLAVWNSTEVALLAGENGSPLWRVAAKSLPDVQVALADDSTAATPAPAPADNAGRNQIVNINGQRIRLQNGGRLVINGVVIQNGVVPPPANAVVPPGGEQIAFVRPSGDKLIAATTNGRLFALDLDAGHVAWQTRITADHPIERLLATDDFAVARFNDGNAIQIIALDAATGQVVRRYDNFRIDNNDLPVNQALSPDGTLVIAMADRLMAKDLYEPGAANKWETPRGSGNFLGAEAPDQFLAQSGRVLAVADSGTFVRLFSLDTGQPATAKGEAGTVPVQLSTGARPNSPVHLRLAGPRLYAFSPQKLRAFDLDKPLGNSGIRSVPEDANLRDLFLGSDFVVAVDEPGVARFIGNPDAPSTKARLLAYSRTPVNGQESGILTHDPVFPEPKGITAWQPAAGGLFYLADQKLHFLKPTAQ